MPSNGGHSPEQTGSHGGAAPPTVAGETRADHMAAMRAAKRKGGARHGHSAKKGKHGSEDQRIAREKMPLFDPENLKYEGEQADRRTVVRWLFNGAGKPDVEDCKGQRGRSVEFCSRMGLPATCADNLRKVMADVRAGIDVREPPARDRAIKMSPGDCAVARDCLNSGFALGQAAANVVAHRLKKLELQIERGLLQLQGSEEEIRETLGEMASVSKETVRVTAHRQDGDVHRRQTKKSGTTDTSAAWAVASLEQVTQMLEQLKAGLGDTVARRNCKHNEWTPFELAQVAFWDERHVKVCLGCLSSYEWRFPVDPNDPECYLPLELGGVLPKEMPRTSAKYLSEARKSYGVALLNQNGDEEGFKFESYDYTSRKVTSYTKYNKRVQTEVERAMNLTGGVWKNAPKKNDVLATHLSSGTRVKELKGGRYEALYPGPVRPGKPGTEEERLRPRREWEWRVREVIAHGNSPTVSVTDMMDHIIWEGDKLFKTTKYKDNWIIGHDALSVWWEKGSLEYLHGRGFGPDRYLCAQGKTNAWSRYYKGCLVGNRPELMPLDSNLNADHERGLVWHAAITSDLDKDDPNKFKMGTPDEVSRSMDRTWEVFPTLERVVQDIRRFPVALQRIKDVKGAVVPEMNNRKGRRRPTVRLPYHPDCEEAVKQRGLKWEQFEADAALEEAAAAAAAAVQSQHS
jgi:hypothetical protein